MAICVYVRGFVCLYKEMKAHIVFVMVYCCMHIFGLHNIMLQQTIGSFPTRYMYINIYALVNKQHI